MLVYITFSFILQIVASCILAIVSVGYGQYQHQHQQPQHIPVLDPHGFQVDTPEVAHAKAAHFAAYAEANSRSGQQRGYEGQYNDGQYHDGQYNGQYNGQHNGLYSAPAAHAAPVAYAGQQQAAYIPSFDQNGYQVDTPEVAHAKAAHLAELAKVKPQEHGASYAPATPYTHVAPAHYNHAAPAHYSHPAPVHYSHPAPASYSHVAPTQYSHAAPLAYGHQAAAHNGAPLDTPEVAQAKAAHAAAHADALARSSGHHQY